MKRPSVFAFLLFVSVIPNSFAGQSGVKTQPTSRAASTLDHIPLSFEAVRGQAPADVKFLSRAPGYVLSLGQSGAQMEFRQASRRATVRMELLNSNHNASITGLDRQPGITNYLVPNDPAHSLSEIPNYARVRYENIYPGVDLLYHGENRRLEYDFMVSPGADPKRIALRFEGAEHAELDSNGELLIATSAGELRQQKPVAYQEIDGNRKPVAIGYVARGSNTFALRIGAYDTSKPLVIDPILTFSTFLGGSWQDSANAVAVDSSGDVYVTGSTNSAEFPTQHDTGQCHPDDDSFIAPCVNPYVIKIDPSGPSVVYSTYFMVGDNGASAIAVDVQGNAYLTGGTNTGVDVAVASQAYMAKLNSAGSQLLYFNIINLSVSTSKVPFLTAGTAIAVDSAGDAYATGNFANDVFVIKLDPSGNTIWSKILFSTTSWDGGSAIAVDSAGAVYIAGFAGSDFPTTSGAFQVACPTTCAFVAKLDSQGSSLLYSTFFGANTTSPSTSISGLAINSAGNAYVTGGTSSLTFPVVNAIQPAPPNPTGQWSQAFITEFNGTGSGLIFSTYLGGTGSQSAAAITLDTFGNIYVAGGTSAADFPTSNPVQPTYPSGALENAFVTELNPSGSAFVYSTYLGGHFDDFARGIAVDSHGNTFVAGSTASLDFPTVRGFQQTLGGSGAAPGQLQGDGFLAEISSTTTAVIPPPSITRSALFNAVQNAMYSDTVTATNGKIPYRWSVVSGSLPAGLTLNSASGNISGNASSTGTVTFKVQVIDANSQTATQTLTIQVNPNAAAPAVATASLPTPTVGQPYSVQLMATGGIPPYTWSLLSPTQCGCPSPGIPPNGLTLASNGVLSGTPTQAGPFGFLVIAIDADYHSSQRQFLSGTVNPGTATWIRVEQTSSAIQYTGTWYPYSSQNINNSGGSATLAVDAGSRATFTFNGTAARWIAYTDQWSGIANVYVDGVFKQQVDNYSSPDQTQVVLYSITGLTAGTHTLAVEVSGTRDASSQGNWIWVDAFDYMAGGNTTTGGGSTGGTTGGGSGGNTTTTFTRVEQNNPAVSYTGTWYANNGSFNSGGSAVLALDQGSRATFTFTGTDARWIGYQDAWSGIANVYVDGVLKTQVDTYSASEQAQAVLYTISGLAAGSHTLTVEVTGTKNPSSNSAWIWVDAFDYANSGTGSGTTGSGGGTTSGGGTGGGTTTTTFTRVEQNNSAISYTGTWYSNNGSFNSGGSAVLALDQGSRATFTFTGTDARWIGYQDAWSGIANVYVDGVLKTQVDTYSATEQAQAVLYTISGLASGTHTLTVEVTGTKNPASNAAWIWVDAFDYASSSASTSGGGSTSGSFTRAEQNSSAVTYTGTWYSNNGSFNSGGSAVLAINTGARATFTFTGTAVKWIGYRDAWSGLANVYIDGVLKAQVDTYSASEQAQAVNYSISGLSSGTHTITIEVTGTKDSSAQSAWVWIDAFDYQ